MNSHNDSFSKPHTSTPPNRPGALVISLDLELRWGTRDSRSPASAVQLLNARDVAHRLLDLFGSKDISATWCAVGMLFAESREELQRFIPDLLPTYQREALNPYPERVGADELDDPLHFAPSLIRVIDSCAGQEIGSHTFSHYYCLEPGQTRPQFEADLRSARQIAKARNLELSSLVFPRNQVDPALFPILAAQGIGCFRGTSRSWVHSASHFAAQRKAHKRALRLVDSYVPLFGDDVVEWPAEVFPNVFELKASRYFRSYAGGSSALASLATDRVVRGITRAAQSGSVYHLWFHPEDFGLYPMENMALLKRVIEVFEQLRKTYGMQSLSMSETCSEAVANEVSKAA